MSFTRDELIRYQRHLGLDGFGAAAQARLRAGSVLVVGAGGLGCPALLYLAAAGVGRIVIVDPDTVAVSNLQRQILYTSADAETKRPKALAAAERLRALNPHLKIEPHVARLSRVNALEFVRSVDVVIDGSDNFATRYLVNDACVLTNRPFVYGAIQGFEGQASVFNLKGGATYRCLFPTPPPLGAAPGCAEAGVLGILPGLIGAVQATETIKLLTGLGEPLSGRLFLYDALAMTTRTLRLVADPHRCPITALPPEDHDAACGIQYQTTENEIGCDALRAALASPCPPQLIDIREARERSLGAIEPSVHIPLGALTTADLSALDAHRPLVLYCAAGKRSLLALAALRSRPDARSLPSNIQSLKGGFSAWSDH